LPVWLHDKIDLKKKHSGQLTHPSDDASSILHCEKEIPPLLQRKHAWDAFSLSSSLIIESQNWHTCRFAAWDASLYPGCSPASSLRGA